MSSSEHGSHDEVAPCAGGFWSRVPKDFLDDPDGVSVPAGLSVFDAHVHVFPPGVSDAIWRWFDKHAWKIRYRLHAEEMVAFLLERGVKRMCALHYAHKPGLARILNRYVREIADAHPEVVPLGTVLPGEPDAREILREALGPLRLHGIKLHCHVQQMAADDPRLDEVYEACSAAGRPVVIHAGREPSFSNAYGVNTRQLCGVDHVARVLRRYPRLTMVVPHLGADEFEEYAALLDEHENLWLDTTMAVGEYFAKRPPVHLFPGRASRLLYGTDFPNVPYAWDRELRLIAASSMSDADRTALLWGNAARLFG